MFLHFITKDFEDGIFEIECYLFIVCIANANNNYTLVITHY